MVSLKGNAVIAKYWIMRHKRIFDDANRLRRSAESHQAEYVQVPDWVYADHDVAESDVHGHRCYTLRPHHRTSERQILYLHGGAYVHQVETAHWRFLSRLVAMTGAAVTVPLYPLAPAHQYDETLAMVWEVVESEIRVPHENLIIMGDSAGGGLAMFLAQRLKAWKLPQPAQLVLISPWLDVTVSDPAISKIAPHDPFLSPVGLKEAARLYTGELDARDPRVSPIYGDLTGLAPLNVFTGTRDILLADSRRLRDLAAERGITIEYVEYEGMFHGWTLQSIPEARQATAEIAGLVSD